MIVMIVVGVVILAVFVGLVVVLMTRIRDEERVQPRRANQQRLQNAPRDETRAEMTQAMEARAEDTARYREQRDG